MVDREIAETLGRMSDRICNLILYADLQWIDIEIQAAAMRAFCETHAPERLDLFEMVYSSRFRRLWQDWGPGGRRMDTDA